MRWIGRTGPRAPRPVVARVRGAPTRLARLAPFVSLAPSAFVTSLLAACAPALDWREVRPPATAVSATMPCKPNVSTRTVALAGRPERLTLLACKADELTWALAAAEMGEPARVGPALAALNEGTRTNLEGEVVESKPAAVRGATPHAAQAHVRLRGRRPDGQPVEARTVVFSHGTQVFQAVVMGQRVPDGPSATFFESLRAGT